MIQFKTNRTARLLQSMKPEPGCHNTECDYYMAGIGNNCVIYPLDGISKVRSCPKSEVSSDI